MKNPNPFKTVFISYSQGIKFTLKEGEKDAKYIIELHYPTIIIKMSGHNWNTLITVVMDQS